MAFKSVIVSVATTATELTSTTDVYADDSRNGQSFLLKNPSASVTVYIGGSDVHTSNNGYPLAPGEEKAFRAGPGEKLYGIVAASTQNVHVLYENV